MYSNCKVLLSRSKIKYPMVWFNFLKPNQFNVIKCRQWTIIWPTKPHRNYFWCWCHLLSTILSKMFIPKTVRNFIRLKWEVMFSGWIWIQTFQTWYASLWFEFMMTMDVQVMRDMYIFIISFEDGGRYMECHQE